jgi:hypothetical protein
MALLTLAAASSGLWAQVNVRGILYDSLRGHGPLSGRSVSIEGSGRAVDTGRDGRFDAVVPLGLPVRFVFWEPWLDSLPLPALAAVVRPTEGADTTFVVLAIPSERGLAIRHCGGPLDGDLGILHGEVRTPRGEPIAGGEVRASWSETEIREQRLIRRDALVTDTTSASGAFLLCGVPRDAFFSVVAVGTAAHTDEVGVGLGGAFTRRRDLIASGSDRSLVVRGRIIGGSGDPLADANVSLAIASGELAATDSGGSFELRGLPRRSGSLLIRAIGYHPRSISVDPVGDGDVDLGSIQLDAIATELEGVRITERYWSAGAAGFEERRKYNPSGTFIDEDQLAIFPQVTGTALATLVPRSLGSKGGLLLVRGIGHCSPRIFVDGLDMGSGEGLGEWLDRAKRIEVYRAAFAPPRFNDFDGCGAVVVWTR